MDSETIAEILQVIKSKYQYIYQVTETANVDSDAGKCLKFMEMRNRLLAEISREQAKLDTQFGDWHALCSENESLTALLHEIGSYIAMIAALDTLMQQRLSRKIDSLRDEISSLNSTSKVVLSYARNTQ
jgi:hypothetical protein